MKINTKMKMKREQKDKHRIEKVKYKHIAIKNLEAKIKKNQEEGRLSRLNEEED
jgi:hypothetical protein